MVITILFTIQGDYFKCVTIGNSFMIRPTLTTSFMGDFTLFLFIYEIIFIKIVHSFTIMVTHFKISHENPCIMYGFYGFKIKC